MDKGTIMDGLTSEDAVKAVGNRYDLVLIGSRRVRELSAGWRSTIKNPKGLITTALQEIEAGLVGVDYLKRPQEVRRERKYNK